MPCFWTIDLMPSSDRVASSAGTAAAAYIDANDQCWATIMAPMNGPKIWPERPMPKTQPNPVERRETGYSGPTKASSPA